jgi:GDP-D-mannose dehydratase
MVKIALITGVTGQDGAYLSQLLLAKGYRVVGAVRRGTSPKLARLKYLDVWRSPTIGASAKMIARYSGRWERAAAQFFDAVAG